MSHRFRHLRPQRKFRVGDKLISIPTGGLEAVVLQVDGTCVHIEFLTDPDACRFGIFDALGIHQWGIWTEGIKPDWHKEGF